MMAGTARRATRARVVDRVSCTRFLSSILDVYRVS